MESSIICTRRSVSGVAGVRKPLGFCGLIRRIEL